MPKYIDSMLPDPETVLGLEPEALAGFVIEYFNSLPANQRESLHPDNFVNPNSRPVNKYPKQYQDSIAKALMEAWEWLVREGLFARKPGSPGWYFVTRRGERMRMASDLRSDRLRERTTIRDGLNIGSSIAVDDQETPLLKSRYRIIRSLAESGFAQTFLGEDVLIPSRRKCIIKRFAFSSNDPKIQDQMLERFAREAINLERLAEHSDQVPDLYAHFADNGRFYLVQEYIEGDTIATKVANHGRLAESVVKELLTNLLIVLKCVHAHSLIHRDIKPSNIVVRETDNKLFLIDFGAIKEIARTIIDPFGDPSTTLVIGTPGYMPTEQGLGRPVFASDLYCLGLTAIFMLTGKHPKELCDLRSGEIVWRNQTTEVSRSFCEVLDRAIKPNFRERFPEATDMLKALDLLTADVLTGEEEIELAPTSSTSFLSILRDVNVPEFAPLKQLVQDPIFEVQLSQACKSAFEKFSNPPYDRWEGLANDVLIMFCASKTFAEYRELTKETDYLYGIAVNHLIAQRRRLDLWPTFGTAKKIENVLLAKETLTLLNRDERLILKLWVGGKNVAEIASELNISPKTVSVQISTIIKKIQQG